MSKLPIFKSGKTSQCWQDIFAYNICGQNGTYIEIGGSWPKKNSNTYSLELYGGYKGFSIEFDKDFYFDSWKNSERKNKVYWNDAILFDYKSILTDNNMFMHVNYLSCDIEPPENTFKALTKVINDGITFDVITFEHDRYNSKIDFDVIARNFLLDNGYKVAVNDVYHKNKNMIFETWFVNNNIDFSETTFELWKNDNILKNGL